MPKVRKLIILRMNSVGAECNELKQSYDACFNVWFAEKFLRQGGGGKQQNVDESMCKPIFLVYKECVRVKTEFIYAVN